MGTCSPRAGCQEGIAPLSVPGGGGAALEGGWDESEARGSCSSGRNVGLRFCNSDFFFFHLSELLPRLQMETWNYKGSPNYIDNSPCRKWLLWHHIPVETPPSLPFLNPQLSTSCTLRSAGIHVLKLHRVCQCCPRGRTTWVSLMWGCFKIPLHPACGAGSFCVVPVGRMAPTSTSFRCPASLSKSG